MRLKNPLADRPVSLSRQLAFAIGGLVVVMVVALAAIAFASVARLAADELPQAMRRNVELRAAQQGQSFGQAEASVKRLGTEWLERAESLPEGQVTRRFEQLFARSADGLWRLRPGLVDPLRVPTFYLQHGPSGPDASARRRAVVSYELLAAQGPALVPPFFSVYVDFVEKGLMVYSRGIDWGRSATPSTDNHDYPTMIGSDPRRNPERARFWTPVYFDAEAHAWIVSVIQPLDWRGRWVGTIGHDITLASLLTTIDGGREDGSTSLILSRDGHLIAHPRLRERIEQASGQLALRELQDPLLDAVQGLIRARAGSGDGTHVARTPDGSHWVAWARIPGPDWWSVTLVPQSQIDMRIRSAVYWILAAGLVCLLLTLLVLRQVIARLVKQPLARVTAAVDALDQRLEHGQESTPIAPEASSELRRLTAAFDAMAGQLAAKRRQALAHAQALEHEVGERRQAEEEVRLLNLSLEARVRERGLALEHAQEELVQKETLAGLGSLVAGVSHELNTPIGNSLMAADTARAALDALAQALATTPVRRSELERHAGLARDSVALALGNLQRSAGLVQDFKQVAIDRASLQRRRFDLKQVSEEVVHLLQYAQKPQRCEVRVELPEGLMLDSYPGPLGQVLTNLVQNAVMHAFEGRGDGRVLIALGPCTAERISLTVSDNGCGIPAEHLGQVFKPFFTTRLGRGGSGLGLHISYSIVCNVLGGSIELASELGRGTRFTLDLPRRAPD